LPDTPQAREASSRLGDLRVAAGDPAGAVSAYATALQGWPTAPWAAATTLELANALNATDRKTQACTALTEFTRRYAEAASPAVRTRATETRTRIGCAAPAAPPARRPG
jgi:TolA-binding protein